MMHMTATAALPGEASMALMNDPPAPPWGRREWVEHSRAPSYFVRNFYNNGVCLVGGGREGGGAQGNIQNSTHTYTHTGLPRKEGKMDDRKNHVEDPSDAG